MAEPPPFDIRYNAVDRLLEMRLCGFWSAATLAAYVAQLLFEVTRLKLRGARYGVFSDTRAFGVQSSLIMAGFDRIAKRGAEFHNGRTAIVTSTHLNKLQAERVVGGPKTRVFLDYDEARAWLLADGDRAGSAGEGTPAAPSR